MRLLGVAGHTTVSPLTITKMTFIWIRSIPYPVKLFFEFIGFFLKQEDYLNKYLRGMIHVHLDRVYALEG